MRHDLRQRWWWWWWWVKPLALPIAAGSPCMGEATRAATLIPPAGLAHGCPARLRAAFAPAVTTPTVAPAANHYFGMTACANKYSGADALASEPAQRACTSHRRSGSPATSALQNIPTRQHRQSVDFGERRCNTLPTLVASTVGRGSRNNFPVVAAVAPVLLQPPFYPVRTSSSTSTPGSGGTPPGPASVILVTPAAATPPSPPRQPRGSLLARQITSPARPDRLPTLGSSARWACAYPPTGPDLHGSIRVSKGGSIPVSVKG